MKEVFSVWKEAKMIGLIFLVASIYALALIPFKGFVLIPNITEFRPASALPVVFGLLFGPIGAWGSAIGNLLADCFSSFGIGSLFGFVGNFMSAYVGHLLWRNLEMARKDDRKTGLIRSSQMIAFIVVALLGSATCALFIGWGAEIAGLMPFASLASIIMINNSLSTIILGLPLLVVAYPWLRRHGLLWTNLKPKGPIRSKVFSSKRIANIMVIFILFGLIGGLATAVLSGQGLLYSGLGVVVNPAVATITSIGVIGVLITAFNIR